MDESEILSVEETSALNRTIKSARRIYKMLVRHRIDEIAKYIKPEQWSSILHCSALGFCSTFPRLSAALDCEGYLDEETITANKVFDSYDADTFFNLLIKYYIVEELALVTTILGDSKEGCMFNCERIYLHRFAVADTILRVEPLYRRFAELTADAVTFQLNELMPDFESGLGKAAGLASQTYAFLLPSEGILSEIRDIIRLLAAHHRDYSTSEWKNIIKYERQLWEDDKS